MALVKEIEQRNGVMTTYHRIMCVNNITNKETQIIIYSYINQAKREEEVNALPEDEIFNVISSESIIHEYVEDLSIKQAYEYLKTLDKFKDAEDA